MFTRIVTLLEAVLTKANDIHRDVKEGTKHTMSAINDLNAQITTLGTSISSEIGASTAAISAALANNDTAAIEAAVANLKGLQTTVDAFTASLAPAVPPVVPAA